MLLEIYYFNELLPALRKFMNMKVKYISLLFFVKNEVILFLSVWMSVRLFIKTYEMDSCLFVGGFKKCGIPFPKNNVY